MLIPVCCDRLPIRLEVAVVSAKGLPVMNKSINSTDAFVEIRFADEVQKTEVVTSLNPQWDSELFPFDTDEKQLVECWLQFRVMDHDTYSANDAIGRVNLDCNILVEKMRMQEMERLDETHILPIYDTLNGGFEYLVVLDLLQSRFRNRGELTFRIKLQLLVDTDFKNYVQILSGYQVPFDYRVIEIVGLMHELKSEKDPDYEWLDRIRTPKATNEARQSAIRDALRSAAVSLAHKVNKHQCNLICGYQEYLDVEGIWNDRVSFPLMSLSEIPGNRQCGIGAIVAVRAVHILEDDDEEPEATRKRCHKNLFE
ncbi:C2 domain protein [Ancylostoma duodenale]|uniref:C2 domain protein n=1 Tax=Ancylostoma duodenale TaxID=51022 RepID=A0A0C2GFP1_9BILA|nr:C2 domain protein [Ancylostoma duodenale]